MSDGPGPERLAAETLQLVEVRSHTGDTVEAARLYGSWLEEAGLDVTLRVEKFPSTPTVVASLHGDRPGPRVVLCVHLDTVPVPHDGPARIEGSRIYGRGAADMKGAAVCALEAARSFAGRAFAGELAIVAIGLHEAPGGRAEDLTYLLGEGGFGADMAVVCELSSHDVAVAHMGQATAEITITRPGSPSHELQTPAGTPHPVVAAAKVIDAVSARSDELAAVEHPWVGAETYFVGEVHGGDFYNRFPATCTIVGTRRWAPGNSLTAVEREYRALLDAVAAESGCTIDLDLRLVRDAYEIGLDEPLVQALRETYVEVTGQALEPVGIKVVADGAIFHQAGIPTVYHGPGGVGAHADVEYVEVAELERATAVYVALLEKLL
ncbi:MAG TPA: M20 family metallopeptidase [Gaiellaceae bacterium]|nr:M20 family metallopeptidase [Gaiellaceae bacterium]